jgi:hypothetical protein
MADDLDENYEIENAFIPKPSVQLNGPQLDGENDEDEDDDNEEQDFTENPGLNSSSQAASKKKRKRKNLTEILELKKDELAQASYATDEFIQQATSYINKKLSSVEKNDLNLGDENVTRRLGKMLLNRTKTHHLPVERQFRKKFNKKLALYAKSREPSGNERHRRSPHLLILAQSAVRCIELQKKLQATMGPLNWLFAFAKHKKLNEQIEFINSKVKKTHIDVVFATPQRVKQLIDAQCLSTSQLRYVFVDYSFRDCKLKRIVDHDNLRADLYELLFAHLMQRNKKKINLKFYLS